MNNWIYFALIAQLIWALCSLIDKFVISNEHIKSPVVYVVLNGLTNLFLVFLLPFAGFERLNLASFLIALLAGLSFSISVTLYYKAVQYDEISRVVMLFQLTPIIVLALSNLFLGEILTFNHYLGFLSLLSAGFVVSYKRVKQSFMLSKAFYLMLLSAFFAAVSLVSGKYIYSVTSFWSAFLWLRLTAISSICVLIVPSIRSQFIETFKNMKNRIKGLLTFKMVIDFSAFIFSGYAILNGPISLVAALSSSAAPLLVFVLSSATSLYFPQLIKENIDKKSISTKIIAIVLIIVGIIFVNR